MKAFLCLSVPTAFPPWVAVLHISLDILQHGTGERRLRQPGALRFARCHCGFGELTGDTGDLIGVNSPDIRMNAFVVRRGRPNIGEY